MANKNVKTPVPVVHDPVEVYTQNPDPGIAKVVPPTGHVPHRSKLIHTSDAELRASMRTIPSR
jgi:hypothetical protein